eukprot:6367093-Amphidinium_carterae.1
MPMQIAADGALPRPQYPGGQCNALPPKLHASCGLNGSVDSTIHRKTCEFEHHGLPVQGRNDPSSKSSLCVANFALDATFIVSEIDCSSILNVWNDLT